MTLIVATNVIGSRPPERQPTGTPHACAKIVGPKKIWSMKKILVYVSHL